MNEEELIQRLNASFSLAATQINEANGKGYKLNLSVPWKDKFLGIKYYHVQLCGIDPISGDDVKNHCISARFDFMKTNHKTEVLSYHGTFHFSCTAHMNDGRSITFKTQEIKLNYPQNRPYIQHTVTNKGDFKLVKLESNCWANCANKVWIRFDGHTQRVALPVRYDKTVRFYVPASSDVDVIVQDSQIQVR